MGEPQPLLLKPDGTDYDAFYLPVDSSGTIPFSNGDIVTLACPNYSVLVDSVSTGLDIIDATCVSGTTFAVNGKNVSFSLITCSSYPYHTARYSGNTCEQSYREIEVGFIVGSRFLLHMLICFDDVEQNTLYSWFNLTKAIGGYQSGFPRPSFLQGSFYNTDTAVNTLYTRATQRVTINNLIGLASNSTKYIQETNSYYMARGHLTAKADFVFGAQHRLTFHYVNAAPQWQTFNGGNWNSLEQNVRTFAANTGFDLIVYTGTYGVATLPHETTGEDVQLYLYIDSNNNRGLPVPQVYWKFVYEPVYKNGIVFIGVNNPYDELSRNLLCDDVTDGITWLTWKKDDQQAGYSYGCSVDEFRQVVSYFPDVEVLGLLQ